MRHTARGVGPLIERRQNHTHFAGGERGGVANEEGAMFDLDARLGLDRAALAHDPGDQLAAVGFQQIRRFGEDLGAFGRQRLRPKLLSGLRREGGLGDVGGRADANGGDGRVGRGIAHVDRAGRCRMPIAGEHLALPARDVDEALALNGHASPPAFRRSRPMCSPMSAIPVPALRGQSPAGLRL